jgi:hypothetical protein
VDAAFSLETPHGRMVVEKVAAKDDIRAGLD